jgi:hypothetical protein
MYPLYNNKKIIKIKIVKNKKEIESLIKIENILIPKNKLVR